MAGRDRDRPPRAMRAMEGREHAVVCGWKRSLARVVPVLSTAPAVLAGCTGRSAPSLTVFGAFFPSWMLCALIGVAAAIAARAAFVALRWGDALPFQLLVCTSIGAICGF